MDRSGEAGWAARGAVALLALVLSTGALAQDDAATTPAKKIFAIVQGPDGALVITDRAGKEKIITPRNAPILNRLDLNSAERIRDARRNVTERSAKKRSDRAEKLKDLREATQFEQQQQQSRKDQFQRDARLKREAQNELIRRNTPGVTSTVRKRSSRSSRYIVPRKTSPRNWNQKSLSNRTSPYITPRKTSPRNWNLQPQSIPTHLLNN